MSKPAEMPNCKNDPGRRYEGTEPSPKGLGWCAHAETTGKARKGRDGRMWTVRVNTSGVKAWRASPARAKVPEFIVHVNAPDKLIAVDATPLDMDTPLGVDSATLVIPLFDLGIPEKDRSVRIVARKGLTLKNLHDGIRSLLAKRVSGATRDKLMSVTTVSFIARLTRSFNKIADFLYRHTVTGIHKSHGKWTLELSS